MFQSIQGRKPTNCKNVSGLVGNLKRQNNILTVFINVSGLVENLKPPNNVPTVFINVSGLDEKTPQITYHVFSK